MNTNSFGDSSHLEVIYERQTEMVQFIINSLQEFMRKSPTKAQESKSTHPLVFDCPTDIHLSMTFANPYEVRKALYGEIARR